MTKTDLKTKSAAKIALSVSRDIPFNKLVLSQSNVRRVKAVNRPGIPGGCLI
jgi:hypothetical protein